MAQFGIWVDPKTCVQVFKSDRDQDCIGDGRSGYNYYVVVGPTMHLPEWIVCCGPTVEAAQTWETFPFDSTQD